MSDRRLNNVERTYIQEEQPNKFHCYIQSMGLVDRMDQTLAKFITGICMKEWWCSPFALMVDAIFQNERMLYLAFRRDVVNAIFLKYSKKGRSFLSHVVVWNVLSDVCYDEKKPYQVPSEKPVRCKVYKKILGTAA